MAPIIHCVRHAQGFHNLGYEFHSLRDPRLTPKGESQCEKLRTTGFSDQSNISLVTASPLSRTLHTAYLTFQPALEDGTCQPQILAIPDAQETSDFPCDTGSDVDALRDFAEEQHWPVNLSLLTNDWNVKTMNGRYSPQSNAIKARAHSARQLIRQKARELVAAGNLNPEIVLVSHGGFLHYFTDDWEDACKQPGTGWENCETRSYTFEMDFSTDEDDFARLVETSESRTKRGYSLPMKPREEQPKLFEQAMQGWERQGLQRPDLIAVPEAKTAAMTDGIPLDMQASNRGVKVQA